MAAAAAVGRANKTKSHNLLVLSSCFLSSTSGAGPWQLFTRRPPMVSPGCAVSSRFTPIRCWWNWCRFDPFAWFRFDPFASFDRCFNHWIVVMEKPIECASKKQIIDYYIETLAKVVGSKEEAKKRISEVYCNENEEEEIDDYSFSCQIDWKTARKVKRLPCVIKLIATDEDSSNDKTRSIESVIRLEQVEKSIELLSLAQREQFLKSLSSHQKGIESLLAVQRDFLGQLEQLDKANDDIRAKTLGLGYGVVPYVVKARASHLRRLRSRESPQPSI